MPNNNYLRSRRREQELVRDYRKDGWIAARTAGSKSPVDVFAFNPDKKTVHLVQIKTKKGASNIVRKHIKIYSDVELTSFTQSYE